jgi:thymidylate synthase (FAD)
MLHGHHKVTLKTITPNADQEIADQARVSVPNSEGKPAHKLIATMLRRGHWSPFDMADITFEMHTTRAITHQLIRHWTCISQAMPAKVQEFSQRYSEVTLLGEPYICDARMQDPDDRQKSIRCEDFHTQAWWTAEQDRLWDHAAALYSEALKKGIAKEVARNVLPEGMTPSRLFLKFPVRTALFFLKVRSEKEGAQLEICELARQMQEIISHEMPSTALGFRDWILSE